MLVHVALLNFRKHGKQMPRDCLFGMSCALILGDALITLGNSNDPDAYRRFITDHEITPTNASKWITLAKEKSLLSNLNLSDKSIPKALSYINRKVKQRSAATDRLAALLAPNPEPRTSEQVSNRRERPQEQIDTENEFWENLDMALGMAILSYQQK